jgi:hypothetical protein
MPHVPSPADAPVDHWVRLFGGSMDAVRVPDGGDIVGSAAWTRLAPRSTFGDAWVDAARLLLPIDWVAVGVTNRLLPEDAGFVIPSTIEVSVVFYNHDHATDWVLCHAHAPVSAGGRATANATVWSEDGHVLALAMVHVLQRGRPRNPTQ